MQIAAAMQSPSIVVCLFRKMKGDIVKLEPRNDSAWRAMNVRRLHKSDGEPETGHVRDDGASGAPRMPAGEAHIADIAEDAPPNRRLRNWILLANAVAWIAIVALIRWLFF